MNKNIFILLGLLFSGIFNSSWGTELEKSNTFKLRKHYKFKVTPLEEGKKYVDVTIVNHTNSGTEWKSLKKSFDRANKIFSANGIGLNLVDAIEVRIPQGSHSITSNEIEGILNEKEEFYKSIELKKYSVHPRALKVYSGILNNLNPNQNMIYLIVFKNVLMKILIRDSSGNVVKKNFSTGAFSNPPYMFTNRIPKEMRGVIGLGPKRGYITMAHELGHKLINVSHEGMEFCPKFSGNSIPGLMGYGGQTDIFSGKEGRFHKERLHLSPFVYKVENGLKVQNADYEMDGIYSDPIYGAFKREEPCD